MTALKIIQQLADMDTSRVVTTRDMNGDDELRQLLAPRRDDGTRGSTRRALRDLVRDGYLSNVPKSGRYFLTQKGATVLFQ